LGCPLANYERKVEIAGLRNEEIGKYSNGGI